jgi:hypothetical protein
MASFAIEVPAETNPLSKENITKSLRSATSTDIHQIQTGTKQLQQWECSEGYFTGLHAAYLDRRIPYEIRYLAIIQLKNGIDRYWRKTAKDAISKQDKAIIRSHLIQGCLDELEDRLAVQNALVIAKIARVEFPNDWPDLLSSILDLLRNAAQLPPLALLRTLLILLHIIKELSTVRTPRTRSLVHEISPQLVTVLNNLYLQAMESWEHNLFQGARLSLAIIKVARRLLIVGYDYPYRSPEVREFWSNTQNVLDICLQFKGKGSEDARENELVDKAILQLVKLHYEMAVENAPAFALLPKSLDLARGYWVLVQQYGAQRSAENKVVAGSASAPVGTDGGVSEKMALKGLLILKALVDIVHDKKGRPLKYRTPQDKAEYDYAKNVLASQLLTKGFVTEIMDILIDKFFVFHVADVMMWDEHPEEWEAREDWDNAVWEFNVRSCCEKLFYDLARYYKKDLAESLEKAFHNVGTLSNENILQKEAVYTAIGLAMPVLHEIIPFDKFIEDTLIHEVRKPVDGYNILRRRAAIMLGQWAPCDTVYQRELICSIFNGLLDKDDPLNNLVVRIAAGRHFAKFVDAWGTVPHHLTPQVDVLLPRLLILIQNVELTETKMAVLNSVSVMIAKLDHEITPYAGIIVPMLDKLWEDAMNEHLMQQVILVAFTRLIDSMKADSQYLHSKVLHVITATVQPGSELAVYLLEDVMSLWLTVLQQSTQPAAEDKLALFPHVVQLYDQDTDVSRQALEITESYLLLAPEFMTSEEVRRPFLAALAQKFADVQGSKGEEPGMICKIMELFIRQANTCHEDVKAVYEDLVPFFSVILAALRTSWTAHCTTGPRSQAPLIDGLLESDYFSCVARLLLGDLDYGRMVLEAASRVLDDKKVPESTPVSFALSSWFVRSFF